MKDAATAPALLAPADSLALDATRCGRSAENQTRPDLVAHANMMIMRLLVAVYGIYAYPVRMVVTTSMQSRERNVAQDFEGVGHDELVTMGWIADPEAYIS
jgi:hypothetical protein